MSVQPGQPTTTANPQQTWGSNDTKNQFKPQGLQPQWTEVDVKTGEISVYRHTKAPGWPLGDGGSIDTKIGTIKPGGTFEARSRADGSPYATGKEIQYYGDTKNRNATLTQAQNVARREWDGKTQPSPNKSIFRKKPASENPTEYSPNYDKTYKTGLPEGSSFEAEELERLKRLREKQNFNKAVKVQKPNTSLGPNELVVYPVAMRMEQGPNRQDYIKLQMLQYAPKKFGDFSKQNLSGSGGRPKNRLGLGAVILPIPGGIADNNAASWGSDKMDPVAMALSSAAYAGIMGGLGAAGEKGKEILEAARGNSGVVKGAIGAAVAGAASKQGASVLQRTEGAILNPNMELLFSGPSLRQFNFSWKLAPRSKDEAIDVIKILRFFKQGMAPIREEPNLFLKSPNTWKLTYNHRNQEHKFLNKFKECALLNCGVQYTPDGNYATFEDGVMTAYQLTLSFQELEPVYSDDYEEVPNTEIGF